jgi:hypothetical protein
MNAKSLGLFLAVFFMSGCETVDSAGNSVVVEPTGQVATLGPAAIPAYDRSVDPMSTGVGSGIRAGSPGMVLNGVRTLQRLPMSRDEVAVIAREQAQYPLGSRENPVRGNSRTYLPRLRCSDGSTPVRLRGEIGFPYPYGSIVDHHYLRCADGSEHVVVVDGYHNWREERPPSGLAIVP